MTVFLLFFFYRGQGLPSLRGKQQVTLLPVPLNVRESSGSKISGVLGQRKCNSFNLLASKVCHLAGFNLALEPSGSTRPP